MEIDELRNLDLNEIMVSFGYERDGKKSDILRNVYITSIGKISIMGSKFFNFSENRGGGGAIDLVMYIRNCDFREACKFLSNNNYKYSYSEKQSSNYGYLHYSEENNINIKQYENGTKINMPRRDDSKINIVVDYLTKIRKINENLVNLLVNHNAIYANSYGSVVFRHCSFIPGSNGKYKTTGATIRGTTNDFKQTLGNKNEGLFWFGKSIKEAKEVILAESPIDIISYFCLKSGSPDNCDNCYISLSGISFPSSLKEFLHFKNIILALDNPNFEKNAVAKEANLNIEKEIKLINPKVIREIPKLKDWNEDLKNA